MGSGFFSNWQRWLFAGLAVAFLWVLAQRFADIQQLAGILIQGKPLWIATAVSLEILYYIVLATLFQSAFTLLDIRTHLRHLIPIAFAFLFVNTTAASGGTAGLALFIDDIRRRGESVARAAAGTLLAHTTNYAIFALLLSIGIYSLFLQHNLTSLEIVSASLLFLLVLGMVLVLVLAMRWPQALARLLAFVQGTANRVGRLVKRPSLLPNNWAEKNATDFIAAADAIAAHPLRLVRLVLLALLIHLIHIGLLLALFLAFEQPITPSTLLVGYTMTILFMIISPTPNGIGVVETVVPLVYTSFGIRSDMGVLITFAFRGLTFWLPMMIGFVVLRQLQMFRGSGRSLATAGQVRLLAFLTALMGLLNVLAALRPALLDPITTLTNYSPVIIQQSSRVTAAVTGFVLLILAHGLWRHKRVAWWLTLIMLLPSIVSHLLQGDYAAATLGLLLGAYLVSQRTHFLALSDPPSVWVGVRVLLAALGFTLAYGVIGFYVLASFEGRPFSLLTSWQQTLLLFTTITTPDFRLATATDFFAASIYIVGLSTLTYALFMLLRPVLTSAPATERERRQAQAIVKQYGRSALATVGTLPGKSYYFTPGGSVIAYTHSRRTAIALGDPIGPAEDLAGAIMSFRAHCQHYDWQAVFYRTPPETLTAYKEAGLSSVRIGQEAVLNLDEFTPMHGAGEGGWQTAVYNPPHSEALLEQLRLISDEWLAATGRREQPFVPDWFDQTYLQVSPLLVVSQETGKGVAFASVVISPNGEEVMLGLLRYGRDAHEGALLALLSALAQWAREQGFAHLNLGFSQTKPEQETTRSTMEHLLHMMRRGNGRHDHDDLHALKTKLAPTWQPRYLIIPGPTSLPAISAALARTTGTRAPAPPA
ncbi:MAG: lysylphosphatidylglycerol synthetase family protein [Ardenticatenaceae bacterium]|nr:lysylphosphatidylglycerol synthetase family protein [Ardenticatenaceae bacterium]